MKKNILFFITIIIGIYLLSTWNSKDKPNKTSLNEIKKTHKYHIDKNPFKETLKLSKKERKLRGLTPNKYNEEQWILNMNPALGRPTPIKVAELQKELLLKQKNLSRTPGDAADNMWINRGPNNVGGRTRALMFDPNDASDNTVFAGSVSGGLWKNTNISSDDSVWQRVDIPENLTISTITFDPNNTQTFYVGTGESYVGHTDGSINGDGIWKSIDGGTTWTNIFGGSTGVSYFVSAANITVNTPSQISGDYQSYPTQNFGPQVTSSITADFILADDSSGNSTEACNSFGTDATGKIAIIRRGSCSFVNKVKKAQNAGAIAVIMMNNISGEPIAMGGTDETITIPAVMISKQNGDMILNAMNSGTVNGSINPPTGDFTATVVPGIQHINDIKIKDNGSGGSEIYVAAADALYSTSNSPTIIGGLSYGLYKSIDGGSNWMEVSMPLTANGKKHCPNDIEVGPNGKIWVSTNRSKLYGDGGGEIFSSTDGINFIKAFTVENGGRTQIAVSSTTPNKVYVLAELTTGGVVIHKTSSAFVPASFVREENLPNDKDNGIEPSDFTRGQAFYDLLLEVDPNNDEVVYTGGIDLFKSTNGGTSWSQFSHWYGGFDYQYIHGDQHIAAFGHNDSNKVIFGNDGGVAYTSNGGTTTEERTNGFITSQYYTVGVGPTSAFTGDYFAGGLQDNGTQSIVNGSTAYPDQSDEIQGGDGAYTFFDQDGSDRYIVANYVYNASINLYNFNGEDVEINKDPASETNGAFINPQALDSNLDILYSNYSADGAYIIKRYSGIKSENTLTKTDLTDELLTTTPTAFTVSPHTKTSSTLLVGTVLGDVLLVENANRGFPVFPTWTNLDENRLMGSVSDIEFGQTENDIFVTMHNYGVNNIWYTNDKGVTWQAKDGDLPDLPVKTILQNPLNLEEVIIGTELGVWHTANFSDENPTWETSYNGMSNVKVLDLDLRDDNMVFAATYGRGVFSGQFTAESLSLDTNTFTASEIKVFPTVSNGELFITSENNIEKTELNVFNITGQNVYSKTVNISNDKTVLNLTSLKSGIYFIQIGKENQKKSHKIIIE
jgi:hypothetical protein